MNDTEFPFRFAAFGHSHLSALLHASRVMQAEGKLNDVKLALLRLNLPELQPNFERRDGKYVLLDPVCRRMKFILRRDDCQAIFLTPMGNEYNTMGMLTHPVPFDFDWPEKNLSADTSRARIPFDLMKGQMRALAERNALLFVSFLASVFEGPIYLIPPPPPIADANHITAHPGAFADRVREYGLNPPMFRQKMWQLYAEVLRDAAVGNVRFSALPSEIYDDGFLKRTYWSEDPTHANPSYGQIVLQGLIDQAKADLALPKVSK